MPEPQWDERLLEFVRRTGEDLKRTGEEFLGSRRSGPSRTSGTRRSRSG